MTNRRFELFEYRQVLVRMRQGDSDRDIARGGLMGRKKLTSVRREAQARGWLDPAQLLPDDTVIAGVFGRTPHLPSTCVSTVEPFREQIRGWLAAGVQGTTIHATLRRNHGYTGSYSAVRRMMVHLAAERGVAATTILEFAPADAVQVDFGAGPVIGVDGINLRTWIFVTPCAKPSSSVSAVIAREVADFDRHLTEIRGLSDSTRDVRRRHVSEFLVDRFGIGAITISKLMPSDVARFVERRTHGLAPNSIKGVGISLRSYLIF
ncbi:hypothetical protein [Paraburkholderia unamae]|uniref:Uncharacterized protein n=1 Tax=Paraburkholderia unamae TaxID=219649 RepID=A0ACC6RW17_9BURK